MRLSYRQIFVIALLAGATLVAGARVAHSQTAVPAPRIPLLIWDENPDYTWTYATGDPFEGQSYVKEVRVTLTPAAGGTPVVSVVPIAQVERGTALDACPPGPARPAGSPAPFPCRKIRDLAAPFGAFNITVQTVNRKDMVGPVSTEVVPFTGAEPTPARARGVRIP